MSATTRLAERAAYLVGRRVSRRDLLRRTALAGSALAVAPVTYALERRTAYAAVCGCSGYTCPCGSLCCDGYTEFCCTISGRNTCPPGTLLGGWWKVDGSSFCGGGARYYLDCNAQCGSCGCGGSGLCAGSCSGTPCGCANGNCGNRKAGCTRFRYGQCHNEVGCLGPIVCRVVTCTPPWQLDGTCTTAALVDNGTRFHNAACLEGEPFGAIDSVTAVDRGFRVQGWVADPDAGGPIDVHAYLNGVGTPLGPTNVQRPDVRARFPSFTWPTGFDAIVRAAGPGPAATMCVYGIASDGGANGGLGCVTVDAGATGALEIAERVPGGIRVTGWAVDLDTPEPVDVHVYVNGTGTVLGPTNVNRPDVAAAYGLDGQSWGFDRIIPFGGTGSVSVCAYGINRGIGANRLLGCRSFTTSGSPVGGVDLVRREPGGVRVAGWAWDPDRASSIPIHVGVGSTVIAAGSTDRPRPDVSARYPGVPANTGFEAVVPFGGGNGPVTVCAYGVDPQGAASSTLGCRTLEAPSDPIGSLDSATRVAGGIRVQGWAIDLDVAGPIAVHVYVNGVGYVLDRTDRSRPDVAAANPGYGAAHGFDSVVPAPAATVVLDAYAIGTGPGRPNRLLGRVTVA